jgi:hypothetical protein
MIRVLFASALAAVVLGCGGVAARADQQLAGAEEAKAMLGRAMAALKADEAAALSAFNDANNKDFRDRDLYVFCFGMADGKITAYSSPGLIGIDVRTLTLKDDPIGQRAYDTVANAPEGSVVTMEYNFPKPGSSTPVPKQTLEARVGNQGCGVAYYK